MTAANAGSGDGDRYSRSPLRSWYFLFLLCIVGVLSILDRQVLTVLVPLIRKDLAISDVQMGLVQGPGFALTYALMALPLSYLVDYRDRRWLIAGCLMLWSGMTLLGGLATGFGMLLATRMLVGIGEAALHPAAYSLLADLFPKRWLSRAIGIFGGAVSLSGGLSILISGALATWFMTSDPLSLAEVLAPWRLTMIAVALPAPFIALLLLTTTKEPLRTTSRAAAASAEPVRLSHELTRNRGLILFLIAGAAAAQVHQYAQVSWFPTYLMRVHQLSMADVGAWLGPITMLSGFSGPIVAGAVADVLDRRFGLQAAFWTLLVTSAGGLLQALAPLCSTSTQSLSVFGLAYFFFSGSIFLVPTIIQRLVHPGARGRVSGVWITVVQLTGLGLGPLAVPLITRHVFADDPQMIGYSISLISAMFVAGAIVLFAISRAVFLGSRPGGASTPDGVDPDFHHAPAIHRPLALSDE